MNNLLTKLIGDRKEWKRMEARANALPSDYRIVYREMKSYMWRFTADDGMDIVAILADVLAEFEGAAAEGKRALEVTGEDVAAYCDARLGDAQPLRPLPGQVAQRPQPGCEEAAPMLTIGQLAAYAGVTVRAVRHYHAKGLLPEPERDHSGYRRYDATAVVDLIRIRTLADAGVPLARVRELMAADEAEFAAAVDEIDRRLRAEIRERQRHREQIAQLAAGDSLALPPEAVAYLDRLRQLDLPQRAIELERDAWILVAAQLPEQMPTLMALKLAQIDTPATTAIYLDLVQAADWEADDPRLPAFADRLVSLIEESAKGWEDVRRRQRLCARRRPGRAARLGLPQERADRPKAVGTDRGARLDGMDSARTQGPRTTVSGTAQAAAFSGARVARGSTRR